MECGEDHENGDVDYKDLGEDGDGENACSRFPWGCDTAYLEGNH